ARVRRRASSLGRPRRRPEADPAWGQAWLLAAPPLRRHRQRFRGGAPMIERTKNDHNTPESVLEVMRDYAPIGLDPCSNMWSTVGARVELCKQRGEDGLDPCWMEIVDSNEIVYVNPPYAAGQIMPWVMTASAHAEISGVETLMLVPCS